MGKLDLCMCTLCEYVIDAYVGDPDNDVKAGTAFLNLSTERICLVCTTKKNGFMPYSKHAGYEVNEELEA